jgi:hypothetical protein
MKNLFFILPFFFLLTSCATAQGQQEEDSFKNIADFSIEDVSVTYDEALAHLVFSITTTGEAGRTQPTKHGSLDGAPVLGYVIPTSLKATDVGFGETEGIVALALTSHPDFDDTPLWDENADRNFANDGIIWHPHWVILQKDDRVTGGFSVKQIEGDAKGLLPPTNPGMPMYMDSPGFQVVTRGNTITTVVPSYRMNNQTDFAYDAVTCYMQVNGSKEGLPMLGVYAVYSIASGDLSLPYKVR